MRGIRLATGLALLLTVTMTASLSAGSYGTELPFVIGIGARASGMGLAYTSLAGDPSVQYFNPALLADARWKQFEFFRTVLFDSKSLYHTASYVHPTLNYGTLGVSILRLDIGGIEERDTDNELLTDDMSNSQTRILIGYARRLHSRLFAGFNLKVDNQSFGSSSGSGIGLDVGFASKQQRKNSRFFKEIREGLAIQNIVEPTLKLDQERVPDPMRVVLGLSAVSELENLTLVTSIDFVNPRFSPFSVRFGQELQLLNHFSLRAGLDDTTPTYGFGARYRAFMVDYAYRDEDLGGNHRISLSISFGASTDERREKSRRELERHIGTEINREMERMERDQIKTALQRADSLFTLEEYDEAIESYEMAQYWDPENDHARARVAEAKYRISFEAGRKFLQNRDYLQAIYHFRQAHSYAPEDTASVSLIRACEQELSESRHRERLIDQLLRKAIDLYAEQRLRDALFGFEEILKIDPFNPLALEYRKKTLINMENAKQRLILQSRGMSKMTDYDGAIRALNDALVYSPGDPMILSEIESLKEKRKAAQAASRIEVKPEPEIIKTRRRISHIDIEVMEAKYRKAMDDFNRGNFEQATQLFMEIWMADPEFHNVSPLLVKTYLLMGMQLYSQEQYENAMEIWEKALAVDPHNTKAKRYLRKTKEEVEKLGGVFNGQSTSSR